MSARYWESENPEEARAGRTLLRWYHKAGRLQFHRTFRAQDGATRTAAVVTLDLAALGESPEALALLQRAMEAASANEQAGRARRRRNSPLRIVN